MMDKNNRSPPFAIETCAFFYMGSDKARLG